MRVLLDYRAALRQRSGVGEYTHELVRALLAERGGLHDRDLSLTLFSSSAKDRFAEDPALAGAMRVDRRVPVRLLNLAWHRLGWPPAEQLASGRFDVAHSMHPLLMPTRAAARVITIYDLNFLHHPERTRAEIRRDYPTLVRVHAHRADHVIVISEFTKAEVQRHLEIPDERITICSPGRPDWAPRESSPNEGYVLFVGTLEPRKNLGTLLDAYEVLAARRASVPRLVLVGATTEQSAPWLARLARPPLASLATHVGYVAPDDRRALYAGARLLVQPSHEEGFGLPVLEAMTVGVPVVAANAGALPEVAGDAALLVPPTVPAALANAIERLLDDKGLAATCIERGFARASRYSWSAAARAALGAYDQAVAHRTRMGGA